MDDLKNKYAILKEKYKKKCEKIRELNKKINKINKIKKNGRYLREGYYCELSQGCKLYEEVLGALRLFVCDITYKYNEQNYIKKNVICSSPHLLKDSLLYSIYKDEYINFFISTYDIEIIKVEKSWK